MAVFDLFFDKLFMVVFPIQYVGWGTPLPYHPRIRRQMYATSQGLVPTLRFQILKYLSWKSPGSIREISQALDKDRRQVRDKLNEMERREEAYSQLTWEIGPNRYFYQVHKYWITPKGLEWLEEFGQ